MIELFDTKYKACSNLFVHTLEGDDFVYPAPLTVYATIEDEQKHLKNEIQFKVNSYLDSILTLDAHFSLFMYVLNYEYKINTIYFNQLQKESTSPDMYGYKGTYLFMNTDIVLNIGEIEIYDDYCKIKQTPLRN